MVLEVWKALCCFFCNWNRKENLLCCQLASSKLQPAFFLPSEKKPCNTCRDQNSLKVFSRIHQRRQSSFSQRKKKTLSYELWARPKENWNWMPFFFWAAFATCDKTRITRNLTGSRERLKIIEIQSAQKILVWVRGVKVAATPFIFLHRSLNSKKSYLVLCVFLGETFE